MINLIKYIYSQSDLETCQSTGDREYKVLLPSDAVASTDRTDFNGKIWSSENVHALELALLSGEYATITDTRVNVLLYERRADQYLSISSRSAGYNRH